MLSAFVPDVDDRVQLSYTHLPGNQQGYTIVLHKTKLVYAESVESGYCTQNSDTCGRAVLHHFWGIINHTDAMVLIASRSGTTKVDERSLP